MLVLSRIEGEGVTFPDLDLEVKLLKIGGNRVQIGIEASPKIRALRSELAPRSVAGVKDSGKLEVHNSTQRTLPRGKPSSGSTQYADTPQGAVQQQIDHLQRIIREAQQQIDVAKTQLLSGNWGQAVKSLNQIPVLPTAVHKVSEPTKKYNLGTPCFHGHLPSPVALQFT